MKIGSGSLTAVKLDYHMDAITEYQKWKQQGESLRMQAKQAMETRFRDLLVEAAQIAQEYHTDFGGRAQTACVRSRLSTSRQPRGVRQRSGRL